MKINRNLRGDNNMNITDMLVSALLKKGVLGEVRNLEMDIPLEGMVIKVKAEHVTLKVEKE